MRWTLARKIGALAALLVFFLLVDGVLNYRALGNIGGEMAEIVDGDLPVSRLVNELNTNGFQEHLAVERVMRGTSLAGDEHRAEREQAAADFESLSRQFDTRIEAANRAVEQAAKITPEYQRFDTEVHLLQKEQQDFTAVARQAIALSSSGKQADADRLATQIEKEASDIDTQAAKMVGLIDGFTAESAR